MTFFKQKHYCGAAGTARRIVASNQALLSGVASVTVDGNAFEGNLIPVDAGKKEVHVKVIMG